MICKKCVYFDEPITEQPCCSCIEGVNFEESEGANNDR